MLCLFLPRQFMFSDCIAYLTLFRVFFFLFLLVLGRVSVRALTREVLVARFFRRNLSVSWSPSSRRTRSAWGSTRSPWGSSVGRIPSETLLEASATVRESVCQGLLHMNSGMKRECDRVPRSQVECAC